MLNILEKPDHPVVQHVWKEMHVHLGSASVLEADDLSTHSMILWEVGVLDMGGGRYIPPILTDPLFFPKMNMNSKEWLAF